MRLNENYYKRLEEDICCCTNQDCSCKEAKTCGEVAKKQYEEYLQVEACKPEPEVTFNICEYDPDQVYFMQYRTKLTLPRDQWEIKIFDQTFDNTFE